MPEEILKAGMDDLRDILLKVYDKGAMKEFLAYCVEWFNREDERRKEEE